MTEASVINGLERLGKKQMRKRDACLISESKPWADASDQATIHPPHRQHAHLIGPFLLSAPFHSSDTV